MPSLSDTSFIQTLLKRHLGLLIEKLEPIQIKPEANSVFQGIIEDREVIVRFSGGRNSFPIERWIYKQFSQNNIPCPEVIAYAENIDEVNQPVIVMTKLSGMKLKEASPIEQVAYFEQLGTLVKRIHNLPVERFGWLEATDSSCIGQFDGWSAYWQAQEYPKVLQYLRDHELITDHEHDVLSHSFDRIEELQLPQGFLLHGDLNAENVLVRDGRITGIIDPAHALSGDPKLDIAVARMWQTGEHRQVFNQGYGEQSEDPLVNKYLLWVASSKLAWRHQNKKESGVVRARQVLDKALSEISVA